MFEQGPVLETDRLRLLPFSLELKKKALVGNAGLEKILGIRVPESWPGPDLKGALPFFIERMENDPTGSIWDGIIVHKADRVAIGGIGFHGAPDETGTVEIGYNIIPEYEGRGYATEMARSVIARALQEQDIRLVTAECLVDNLGSIRVLEKVGMRRLGLEGNMLKWSMSKPE